MYNYHYQCSDLFSNILFMLSFVVVDVGGTDRVEYMETSFHATSRNRIELAVEETSSTEISERTRRPRNYVSAVCREQNRLGKRR